MANFCPNCGKKLSFLERHDTKVLCNECNDVLARTYQSQLADLEQSIVASRTVTPEQLALLKTCDHKTVLDLYFRLYNAFLVDKELDEYDIFTLSEIQRAGALTDQEVRYDELIRTYYYVNSIRTEGNLPAMNLTVSGTGPVILRKGEVVHYAHEATLNEIRRISLGYRGGSHGVSFRVFQGVYYRVGAHRGHILSEDRLTQTSSGVLIVTNQRIGCSPPRATSR